MSTVWSKEVFAKNLQRYMDASGKTQKEVADIIGVSAPTFHEWLKGKKYPRIDKIEKLAQYFGILKSDLIEEKTDEHREMQKNNKVIADLIVKMRTDEEFLFLVHDLSLLDEEKRKGVKQLLAAFLK